MTPTSPSSDPRDVKRARTKWYSGRAQVEPPCEERFKMSIPHNADGFVIGPDGFAESSADLRAAPSVVLY